MWTAQVILWLTNSVIGIIEFALLLRLVLKFIGANTVAPFVQWVYETTQPLLQPFAGMLPTVVVPGITTRFTVEFTTLFALLVYAFIGYLIGELLAYLNYRRTIYSTDEDEDVVLEKPVRRKRVIA